MAQGVVTGKEFFFSFLFGKELVFTAANGKIYTVFQPGYTLDLSGGIFKIRPTTAADIARVMTLLTNGDTSAIGQSDDEECEGTDAVTVLANISNEMAELFSDATANQIQATLRAQLLLLLEDDVTPPTTPIPDTLSGYAAATMISTSHPGTASQLVGISLSDFAFFFNGETGSSQMVLRDVEGNDGAVSAYRFNVPIGPTQAGLPGHIGSMGASVLNDAGQPYAQTSSSGAFFIGNPNGGAVLCARCDFMRWGVVTTGVTFGNYSPTDFQDNITGFWVAGDLPTVGQLPTSGSATYVGNTLGTAAYQSSPGSWQLRVASGAANMSWNFAHRMGNLTISNFDAGGPAGTQHYSGTMSMTGSSAARNMFQGYLFGTGTGAAIGPFARKGADPAAGVLGNWYGSSSNYRATGVFGAAR
jgi:hypothetical protein